jgi:penicillin-binding protein 2
VIPLFVSQSDPANVASAFAQAWQEGNFDAMYALLTAHTRERISRSDFQERYASVQNQATILDLSAQLVALSAEPENRKIAHLRVRLNTAAVGVVDARSRLTLEPDDGDWRISWTPEAILEGLREHATIYATSRAAPRGNIYARDGTGLAIQTRVITLGVVPAWIRDENKLLAVLNTVLKLPRDEIRRRYVSAIRPDWFMPIGEITPEQAATYQALLSSTPGISQQEKATRAYPSGALVMPVLGYTGKISAEELEQMRALGYQADDVIGKAGIEKWAERYLVGRRGGTLAIVTESGQSTAILKDEAPQPSKSAYLTLDYGLQETASRALGERIGAVVAMDPNNGEILAMVSRPSVDAAALSRGFSTEQWQALLNRTDNPLVDRAAQGQYPLASVFKIVTAAAALEEGHLDAHKTYYCGGSWMGLGDGLLRNCWLTSGHGYLDISEGLVQSCDVVFYEIGKSLHAAGANLLSDYARLFGFGRAIGVEGIAEAAGLVPDSKWKESYPDRVSNPYWTAQDTINLSIGQGYLLVTPLQAANMMAAVANGGTLYRPRIIQQIVSLREGETIAFRPEPIGQLPISQVNLALIRDALRQVVASPIGTAHQAFQGSSVSVAGKTGTAETGKEEPHAWFVGYAPADKPRIVVAVIVEHGGEGAATAAPIFRQVVESYLQAASLTPQPPSR